MININIPNSCGKCKYGNTYDLSIDNLCTYCYVLDYSQDWCDIPRMQDGTMRFRECPLPNLTNKQVKMADNKIETHKAKRKFAHRMIHGKTKLIRKRNESRLMKLANINTGKIPLRWFI